jgi:hypothetical protein
MQYGWDRWDRVGPTQVEWSEFVTGSHKRKTGLKLRFGALFLRIW